MTTGAAIVDMDDRIQIVPAYESSYVLGDATDIGISDDSELD